MNRIISLVVLVTGIVLLVYCFNASQSLGSDISRFFTGAPTDKTIWLLFVGGSATVLGLGGLLRAPRVTDNI